MTIVKYAIMILTINQKVALFVTVVITGIVSHVWEWQKDVLMS